MKAKYIRVSTIDQNTERQEDKNFIEYIDKISGAIPFDKRPASKELMKDIESGKINYLEVHTIDRLGRNLRDILKTIDFLKENKCNLNIKNLGLEMLDDKGEESTSFALMSAIFGTIAQLERDQIRERQKEGVAIAKAKGVYKGRKEGSKDSEEKTLAKYKNVVNCYESKMSIRKAVSTTGVSQSTVVKVYKILNESKGLANLNSKTLKDEKKKNQ